MSKEQDLAKITVVMPKALRDAARAKAKRLHTPLSEVIRSHLREWLAEPLPDLMAWTQGLERDPGHRDS